MEGTQAGYIHDVIKYCNELGTKDVDRNPSHHIPMNDVSSCVVSASVALIPIRPLAWYAMYVQLMVSQIQLTSRHWKVMRRDKEDVKGGTGWEQWKRDRAVILDAHSCRFDIRMYKYRSAIGYSLGK